ncbi:MAG: carbohydrate ABC transporter permease [Clostridiales bacterium]|nr:carbohydrate ABC transporter permease [Clostridiales bacterium]
MKKRIKKIGFADVLIHTFLMLASLLMIGTFLILVICSLKPNQDILKFPNGLTSPNWTFSNYTSVFEKLDLGRATINTFFITVVKTSLVLYSSAIAAYVLEKTRFRGRKALFFAVLCTMMVPGTTLVVPNYNMMTWFGWLNNYAALIVPSIFKAYGIFLVKQYLEGIPDYFVDAARVDGASETLIFHRLMLPMMHGALFPLGIMTVIETWNDFMWPYIILSDRAKFTLPIALQTLSNQYWNDFSWMLAGVVISSIPIFLVYIFGQDKIIEGLAYSGTTG